MPIFLKKSALSGMDKGSKVIVKLMRPKKAALFKIFSSIQVETDPQNTSRIGLVCLSHQALSLGIKVGSFAPIQEISSNKIISPAFICSAKCSKASVQSKKVIAGILSINDNCLAK